MRLGVQVSIAGAIYEAVDRARDLGCGTMQIFSRNPRQRRHRELDPQETGEFRKRRKESDIRPVFIHIPYTINLASPNDYLYRKSIEVYIHDINEAAALGAEYVVTHMGSHMKQGEEQGLLRFSAALDIILTGTDSSVGILLENTSGSGSWLGYKFEHQRRVLGALRDPRRVGVCLDTCHAYSAGYDIATTEGLEQAVEELDSLIGLDRLKLIHLNDSRDKLNSRRDRHEHIGKGKIGQEGFRNILNHPRLKDLAFILETPKKSEEDDRKNLGVVRSLVR